MNNVVKEITVALRSLGRSPGFMIVASGALALGIGANTAIFSIVEDVLLRPLPFRAPEQLVSIWQKSTSVPQLGISELDLADYRTRSRVFEELGGYTVPGIRSAVLTAAGDPVEISPSFVTQNYFHLLGLKPVIGRDFLPEEDLRGRDSAAILGYSLWKSRFSGSPGVLQKQITLDNRTLRIVGVMGPDISPAEADVFLPFTRLDPERPAPRNYHSLNVVGRMRPGQTVAQAQSELAAISSEIAARYPATNAGIGISVVALREEIVGKVQETILMLWGAVGLVLLIACGNVANLLLVRAAGRQKDVAIRLALGASRGRIARQFLIESLVLAMVGGAAGTLLAYCSMPLLRYLAAGRIPRLQMLTLNAPVLIFSFFVALLTGVAFGLFPAVRYSGANINRALRAGGRTSQADSGGVRSALVIVEVMLALVVIVGAGLLVRSFNQLLHVDPGFHPDHVLVAQIALPRTRYRPADVRKFYERLLPKVQSIPGVVSVSTTSALPLASGVTQTRFLIQGGAAAEPGRYPVTAIASVGVDYFKTLQIPVLRGRGFRGADVGAEDWSCIINATLAHRFFGGSDPIGRILLTNVAAPVPDPCPIIGVVGDTRLAALDLPPDPVLYAAAFTTRDNLVLRTVGDPASVAPALQRAVRETDPAQPLSNVRSMNAVIDHSLSNYRFSATLLSIFSGIGLLLAAMGLYGVLSYSVTQRTQEVGVRVALGATPGQIFQMVLLEGLILTAMGLAAGALLAAASSKMISSLLFGISAADPVSYIVACGILVAVAALACFVPARRATRVDPLEALRYE